jgi:hypothetical protein
MYASLSAEITASIGKISAFCREENLDQSGEQFWQTLTFENQFSAFMHHVFSCLIT